MTAAELATLTPEEKRVKIAEALGWTHDAPNLPTNDGTLWVNPSGRINHGCGFPDFPPEIPDYLNDINAMHEAEWTLDPVQYRKFADELWELARIEAKTDRTLERYLSATAARRADAFLLAL